MERKEKDTTTHLVGILGGINLPRSSEDNMPLLHKADAIRMSESLHREGTKLNIVEVLRMELLKNKNRVFLENLSGGGGKFHCLQFWSGKKWGWLASLLMKLNEMSVSTLNSQRRPIMDVRFTMCVGSWCLNLLGKGASVELWKHVPNKNGILPARQKWCADLPGAKERACQVGTQARPYPEIWEWIFKRDSKILARTEQKAISDARRRSQRIPVSASKLLEAPFHRSKGECPH